MNKQKSTRIYGESAFQSACQKARYGHREWLVWTGKDGNRQADYLTPKTMKEALLVNGTQGNNWTLIERDGSSSIGFWWMGINLINQMKRKYSRVSVDYMHFAS